MQNYCTTNGMELFFIDSAETETAITSLANSQYPSGWLWVQGKNGANCAVLRRTSGLSVFTVTQASCTTLAAYGYCGYTRKSITFDIKKKLNFNVFTKI
jgi:hypothetical protein